MGNGAVVGTGYYSQVTLIDSLAGQGHSPLDHLLGDLVQDGFCLAMSGRADDRREGMVEAVFEGRGLVLIGRVGGKRAEKDFFLTGRWRSAQ